MRTFLIYLAVSAVLLPAALTPIAALEAKTNNPLTLQECLDIAMRNQIDILIGENSVSGAESKATQAKAGYFPQITVQNNTFSSASSGVVTKRKTGTAISATLNVFDGGLRETRTAGARYGVEQSRAGLDRIKQLVVFDVNKAYYDVLRAKHLADVAEADVKYNEELKEIVEARVELGAAAQVDVLPVDAQLATARVNLLSARNSIKTAMVYLQNSIGLSTRQDFDVRDVDADPNPEIRPLDSYITAALESRPDIRQSQASLGTARANTKASRIALYPQPQISAEYLKGFGELSEENSQIFGGITFDIFNGGANRAAYKEALANQDSADQRNHQLTMDIQAQVEEAYLNLTNAKERLTASHIGFEAAEKNFDVQQARYRQGLAVPLDLLNAELQLVTARTNLVKARYDYHTAVAQMDWAVGKAGGFNAG